MKNTGDEEGDLHHRIQSLTNVFVEGWSQLFCDAGGRVSIGVQPWGRDLAPAVAGD
jgi:hypothetical protein